jgi:hypothetical protein
MTVTAEPTNFSSSASQMGLEVPLAEPKQSAWQARRQKRRNSKKKQLESMPEDEYDPYESDPGESYRDHCERLEEEEGGGGQSKTCLALPKFLRKSRSPTTTLQPLNDDSWEEEHPTPQSLPKDLARLCYSLRSNIGNGSQAQDEEMQQRLLRPNNVHINVSHWSDFGKRNYMEDRYVPICVVFYLPIPS